MKHIAIDLETMGVSPLAPIMAIGAVEFDVGDTYVPRLGREFYVRVDLQSCLDLGLLPDASTMEWWLTKTTQEAREALFNGEVVSISKALSMFSSWFPHVEKEPGVLVPDDGVCVWARGQDFDIGIMRTAYKLARMPHPWYYNRARDSRTLIEGTGFDVSRVGENTDAHNALSDAKWEARAIAGAMVNQIKLHYDFSLAEAKAAGREHPADEVIRHLCSEAGRPGASVITHHEEPQLEN